MEISDDRALEIAIAALAKRAEHVAEDRRYRKRLVASMHEKGLPVEYIAEYTGLKVGTVKDYINRGEQP